MPNKIQLLSEVTANQIAAGEVVERPASVVKELVENSIDAGSTKISIFITGGGLTCIKVKDNGSGMTKEDAILAFERHATSKISSIEDLNTLNTLGFRGEALPSIAAVARVVLTTRTAESMEGTHLEISAGKIDQVTETGCPVGTEIVVYDLFYNTPARLKFLKTSATETGHILETVTKLALAYPEIAFSVVNGGKRVLSTSGDGNLLNACASLYGREMARELLPVSKKQDGLAISGYISKPTLTRANRNQQFLFVNRRAVRSWLVNDAINKAYHTLVEPNRYPVTILNLDIKPSLVDVNIHPAKMEVRFSREKDVYQLVFHSIRQSLEEACLIPEISIRQENIPQFSGTATGNHGYVQESLGSYFSPGILSPSSAGMEEARTDFHTEEAMDDLPQDHLPVSLQMKDNNAADTSKNGFEIIGQAFDLYIVAQDREGIVLVDQHAAHERILFERYTELANCHTIEAQILLVPEMLELAPQELVILNQYMDALSQLGFTFTPFGGSTILIRSIPLICQGMSTKQLILDLLHELQTNESLNDPHHFSYAMLAMLACKTAVKANQKLSKLEMESLLSQLFQAKQPYTCPHGRPTMLRLDFQELGKRFKRI